jgi:outer membrane autotransporter protein
MRAVSSHISDELIVPLIGRQEQKAQKSIWFREIGTFAKYKDHGGRLGHTDETYDRIMGYDWISMKNIMLGGYFGYTRTELETTTDATTSMKLPHAGLYGAARMGDFYITANLAYGLGGADTERREDFGNIVKGSYDLDSIGGDLEIGYVLPFSASGKIRPSIGIQHMNLSFHDYAETGTGAVRLDDLHASSWQGTARLEATEAVTMPWGLPGVMSLGIGWTQSLHNERTEAWATLVDHPDARLHIRSEDYDRSGVTLGLGLRMMLSKSAMWAFAYDFDSSYFGAHNNDAVRHTISSMIRISW